jgi:DNA-binding phage protein
MILTVNELRQFVTTQEGDPALEARLQALEASIMRYTNNSFTRVLEENGGAWPADIKMGVVKLVQYDMSKTAKKAGIAAETLSRHSVTYEARTADNTAMGYPIALTAFLKPYMRARFGQRRAWT